MKSRNELAEEILLRICSGSDRHEEQADEVRVAFEYADAFLAAAGERQEREPDAVWMLRKDSDWDVVLEDPSSRPDDNLITYEKYPEGTGGRLSRLLADRERVRLKVYVEEVES